MEYKKRLHEWMEQKEIKAEFLEFEDSVYNSENSSKYSGHEKSNILKTVLFKDKKNQIYAVIVRGIHKIDKNKIRKRYSCSKITLMNSEDVLKSTSYPTGGVPPFGYDAKFIIDENICDEEEMLAGGGDTHTLIKIKVSEIKRITKPEIFDVIQKEQQHNITNHTEERESRKYL